MAVTELQDDELMRDSCVARSAFRIWRSREAYALTEGPFGGIGGGYPGPATRVALTEGPFGGIGGGYPGPANRVALTEGPFGGIGGGYPGPAKARLALISRMAIRSDERKVNKLRVIATFSLVCIDFVQFSVIQKM